MAAGQVRTLVGRFSNSWRLAPQVAEGNALSARNVFNGFQRWLLLAIFALVVILRLPNAWEHGRFQDEEATVFLAYAWHHPWADALFRPFGGYWNLGANAVTVLVAQMVQNGLLPLERAPYVTMVAALNFQLIPAVLILTGNAYWLAGRLPVIFALLIIATMPATEEVFFNVLHIQFHLALCVALILALDVPARRIAKAGYGLLLFLAPLCGPGAIVLVPLFALRALIDRDMGRLGQLAILGAGTAVQLLLFFGSSPVRGHSLDLHLTVAAIFVRLIALPFLGVDSANRIGVAVTDPQIAAVALAWLLAAAAVLLFGALVAFATQRRDSATWLTFSGLLVAAISFGPGIATVNPEDAFFVTLGERYNFLPLVLLGLALIALAMRSSSRGKSIFAAMCLLMVLNGAYHYPRPIEAFAHGPSWPAEVRAWRSNQDHPLAVWPSPWAADLSDRPRTCSPPKPKFNGSTEPRYCESGWMASFHRGGDQGRVR